MFLFYIRERLPNKKQKTYTQLGLLAERVNILFTAVSSRRVYYFSLLQII